MTLDPRQIKESFALVQGSEDDVASHFYAMLFVENPELRDMFPPMMDAQRGRLLNALIRVVHSFEEPDEVIEYLQQLGRDHRKFGVKAEHYAAVWHCLVDSLKRYAGSGWTEAMDESWYAAYEAVAGTMIAAADDSAKIAPPWWTARVVEHEQRSPDIAVLTLLPDQPFPYRAGQYISLETQMWPRVWRYYSIANAPRTDGTLTIHVRAIDAGWVSGALVRHTSVGDVIRIGPAMGGMTCDSASHRDVLCIAGGTGLAPVKAMVEDMARWNTERRVHLLFGCRRPEDLYDMRDLQRLAQQHPWLSLLPAISHDDRYPGERGMLPDVVARHGAANDNWVHHDVYLSGSSTMVRATVARLQEMEVPLANIRFDAYDDPADLYASLGSEQRGEDRRTAAERKVDDIEARLAEAERRAAEAEERAAAAELAAAAERRVAAAPAPVETPEPEPAMEEIEPEAPEITLDTSDAAPLPKRKPNGAALAALRGDAMPDGDGGKRSRTSVFSSRT